MHKRSCKLVRHDANLACDLGGPVKFQSRWERQWQRRGQTQLHVWIMMSMGCSCVQASSWAQISGETKSKFLTVKGHQAPSQWDIYWTAHQVNTSYKMSETGSSYICCQQSDDKIMPCHLGVAGVGKPPSDSRSAPISFPLALCPPPPPPPTFHDLRTATC